MGAVNFDREFTSKFAEIAALLDECRSQKNIKWNQEQTEAFEKIKKVFQEGIGLRIIDWNKKMYLTTDASQVGIGAWIGQIDDSGELVPVICASKKFSPTQRRWPATKRELYGLMWGMKKFRN